MTDKERREKERENREIMRARRLKAAQDRQKAADERTYGSSADTFGRREGGIWDVSTEGYDKDLNKTGTEERIQNDGVDRLPGAGTIGATTVGNTLELDYVDDNNTAKVATFLVQ